MAIMEKKDFFEGYREISLDDCLDKVTIENSKYIKEEPESQLANEDQSDAQLSAEDKKTKDAFEASNI